MTEKRQPWGKWYWGDWRKDARLRRCSYAARGLWADMLSLLGGECDHYGVLIMEGQALAVPDLIGLLGGAEREVRKLLAELEGKNVFSRVGSPDMPKDVLEALPVDLPAGTIVSRRMIRDKAKEAKDIKNGKGGGNPKLTGKDPVGLTPPVKAQKPEARDQKLEREDSGGQGQSAASPPLDASRREPPDGDPADLVEAVPLAFDRTECGDVVKAWNEMATRAKLPTVAKVTQARRRNIMARLKDCGANPLEGIKAAVAKVEASAFLTGKRGGSDGHESWICRFDFFISDSGFTKIMEGSYDDRESGGNTPKFRNGFAALDAEIERRIAAGDG